MPEFGKRRLPNTSVDRTVDGLTEFERKKQHHASGESTASTDSASRYIPTPLDGGYGWVIVFASFMNHVIVDGIAFTFGIFYGEFLESFKSGKGETALVGALLSGFYLLTAPVAGSLVNKFSCRSVSIAGALIAFLGFSLSTFSTNIKLLSLTYGVIGGFGLGLLYLPNIVSVSYYFHQRRALATGIAVCGAGVGCFVFAPVGQWLLEVYDWRNAMLIVAGVTLNGCVFGALLRTLEPVGHVKKPREKNLFDRLKEDIAKKTRFRKTSDYVPARKEIIQKVQEIKEAREKALHEEEMESGSPASLLNSLELIERQTSQNSTRESKSVGSDSGLPVSFIIPDVIIEGPAGGQKYCNIMKASSDNDNSVTNANRKPSEKIGNNLTTNGDGCAANEEAKKNVFLSPGTHSMFAGLEKKCASDNYIGTKANRHYRKLPQGVHRSDLARPLYRSDIFYGGSFINIPEFRSQPNVTSYIRSLTAIPGELEPEESFICRCIPISKAAKDALKQMTDISLLRKPVFLIPCLANLFGAIGLFIPFVYSTDRAISLGVEPQQAAFLLSVIGITNTLGRILAGFLADLKHVSPLLLHNVALVAGGVACILNMFCVDYVMMCIFAAFFGLCVATWISLTSIVLCNLLGLERLTNAFGLLTMTRGIATLVGSPVAGLVFDATRDYNASFHVGGSMLLMGGLLCCLLHLPIFRKNELPFPENGIMNPKILEPETDGINNVAKAS